ncbi:hypothetical protein C0584_04380 [Candidatus Parcubacteria bacterium]|nr:MAG: hypothetical protein C0584_04380 [Candidatus Parcubacteria bacterium]
MQNENNLDNLEDLDLKKEEDSISKVNIDRFKERDGVSLKKLGFGLWYLEHQKGLMLTVYIFLGLIGFVTWFSFFKTFGHYVLIGMKEDQALVASMINNSGIKHSEVVKTAPQELQVGTAEVLLNSNGTYDIVIKIKNINSRYYSRFSYFILFNNEKLGPFNDFILPEEEKYLMLLDQKLSRRPSSVSLEVEHSWTKLDGHKIKEWAEYRDNYIDFIVDNKVFSNPKESNLSEKLNLSSVKFDLTNNSAYSYYELSLDILLYSRGRLASVNQYPIERIESGETRGIDITWPGKVNRADNIEVVPNIDIMKDNITYIP